ncbi:MAG: hypothetical protein F6K48_30420 [Okeania sp. SIO3H1]|nr:hypothetical protein [Okeania sp. SIO3H1]
MGRWGDGDPPLTPPRRGMWGDGEMGRWGDSYICTIKCISYSYKYSRYDKELALRFICTG